MIQDVLIYENRAAREPPYSSSLMQDSPSHWVETVPIAGLDYLYSNG